MIYEVRLLVTTESEILIHVDHDVGADPDDVYDRAVQLLRDGDVQLGLDYTEEAIGTEFSNNGVVAVPDDQDETEEIPG
jgi:hypothetical protein